MGQRRQPQENPPGKGAAKNDNDPDRIPCAIAQHKAFSVTPAP
jgi:hypothetical protein